MKKMIIPCVAVVAFVSLAACSSTPENPVPPLPPPDTTNVNPATQPRMQRPDDTNNGSEMSKLANP